MKNLAKISVLGAALVAFGPFASASLLTGGLTIVGTDKTDDSFTTTTISFLTPSGSPASNANVTGATGNLAFAAGTSGVMTGFTSTTTNQTIFTDNGTQGLSFELLSIAQFSDSYLSGFGTSLTVKGTGEFFDTAGDTAEIGTFVLSSSDTECTGTSCTTPDDISFGFTPAANPAAVTPEPNSLILLGSGMLGGAGLLLRKRRTV